MAAPTSYSLSYDFTAYQTANPSDPLPADKLEIEFNNLETTTDEIIANLGLIQRSDGELANASVGNDQLKDEVVIGLNPTGDWVTSTAYAVNDVVYESNKVYKCLIAHTSGTFATDLAALKWEELLDFDQFITATEADLTAVEADLASIEADLAATEGDASTTEADVTAVEADLTAMEADLAAITGDTAAVEADLAAVESDLSATEGDSTATAADLLATEADVALTGADVTATEADLAATEGDSTATAADLTATEADLAATEGDASTTEADVTAVESDLASMEADLAAISGDTAAVEADLASVESDLSATEGDATATAADLLATEADVAFTGADLTATESDLAATEGDSTATAADLVATEADLAATEGDATATAADLALVEADLSATEADLTATEADLAATEADVGGLNLPTPVASKYGALLVQNDADDGFDLLTSQGTSGQILTSNGADALPSFQDAAGGAWNLISTQTASASSTIDFTSSIDSTYDTYALVFNRVIPATDDVTLQFRTGNTTFDTGANYAWSGSRVHSSGSSSNNTADNQFNINIDGGIGNASGEQMSGIMYIFDPSNSGSYPTVRWESTHINNVGGTTMTSGSGSYLSNTAIDRFRFFFSSGNIASGSFSLYGISHT